MEENPYKAPAESSASFATCQRDTASEFISATGYLVVFVPAVLVLSDGMAARELGMTLWVIGGSLWIPAIVIFTLWKRGGHRAA